MQQTIVTAKRWHGGGEQKVIDPDVVELSMGREVDGLVRFS